MGNNSQNSPRTNLLFTMFKLGIIKHEWFTENVQFAIVQDVLDNTLKNHGLNRHDIYMDEHKG